VCWCVLGMWYDILQFINMVGVVTNACLIAFTSSWGNKYDITGQLVIVIVFEVRPPVRPSVRLSVCLSVVVSFVISDTSQHTAVGLTQIYTVLIT